MNKDAEKCIRIAVPVPEKLYKLHFADMSCLENNIHCEPDDERIHKVDDVFIDEKNKYKEFKNSDNEFEQRPFFIDACKNFEDAGMTTGHLVDYMEELDQGSRVDVATSSRGKRG
jgi:hypothetical protein